MGRRGMIFLFDPTQVQNIFLSISKMNDDECEHRLRLLKIGTAISVFERKGQTKWDAGVHKCYTCSI